MKRLIFCGVIFYLLVKTVPLSAQQYTGMTGLIHVPTAEMNCEGDAHIGAYFINKHFTPGDKFSYEGEKYNTFSYYLSITPFWWIELGYTCTLFKKGPPLYEDAGYKEKDRYFSLKLNPLKEGRWWPAIAAGCNDVSDSYSVMHVDDSDGVESFFGNYYLAASKHFILGKEVLGTHIAYRHFVKDYNSKWNGFVGGLTYRPSFADNCRFITECTGNEINIGMDVLLFRHFLIQASMQQAKYFSGGICYQLNLF